MNADGRGMKVCVCGDGGDVSAVLAAMSEKKMMELLEPMFTAKPGQEKTLLLEIPSTVPAGEEEAYARAWMERVAGGGDYQADIDRLEACPTLGLCNFHDPDPIQEMDEYVPPRKQSEGRRFDGSLKGKHKFF